MIVIRMMRVGSKKKPYFRVVVTEARTARETRFIENVGTYNPRSKPAVVQINRERVNHWLQNGARPSDSVRTLLGKHLSRDLSAPAETPVETPAAPPAQ
jgi:small subunit ribosomal protein S16